MRVMSDAEKVLSLIMDWKSRKKLGKLRRMKIKGRKKCKAGEKIEHLSPKERGGMLGILAMVQVIEKRKKSSQK